MYKIHQGDNENYLDTNTDMTPDLLQIWSTPIRLGLPNPEAILFKRPVRELLLRIYRPPITCDYDEENYTVV